MTSPSEEVLSLPLQHYNSVSSLEGQSTAPLGHHSQAIGASHSYYVVMTQARGRGAYRDTSSIVPMIWRENACTYTVLIKAGL